MRILKNNAFPILILLILNVIIGTVIVSDFGASRDESFRYHYAVQSLDAYKGVKHNLNDEKGPFYVMIAKLGADVMHKLFSWSIIDGWHFMHFLSFLFGLFFLYILLLQFVGKWAAFGAVLIFNTQPLLFGHAFINPKDIPFMAFFTASFTMGLLMVNSISVDKPNELSSENPKKGNPIGWKGYIKDDWKQHSALAKYFYILFLFLGIVLFVGVFLNQGIIHTITAAIIQQVYHTNQPTILHKVFQQFTENTGYVPLEGYIHKAQIIQKRLITIAAAIFILLAGFFTIKIFKNTTIKCWSLFIKPFYSTIMRGAQNWKIWAAGLLMGFTSAIRILGPASGILIAIYFILRRRSKAIPYLVLYFLIGLITTYLCWPWLWGSPLESFIQSFSAAANFPWSGKVLFAGTEYIPNDLPWTYLPVLLTIQFTIPTLAIFLLGCIAVINRLIKNTIDRGIMLLLALWFGIPAMWVILFHPTVYDNFRHFLFIIPPLFILCGFGLQAIFDYLKLPKSYNLMLYSVLFILLILPNIYRNVKLHPYEYVYYNQLVGGVYGAFGKYEMDYWTTSYKEDVDYINLVAPSGATVIVWGPAHNVEQYARKDIIVQKYHKGKVKETPPGSYLVLSSNLRKDLYLYPDAPVLFQTGREDAIYSVVKQLPSK